MKHLLKRIKYKILSLKRGYDVEVEERSQRAYDKSIDRIVQANPVLCLCEVDRVAKPFHELIKKSTDAYNQAREPQERYSNTEELLEYLNNQDPRVLLDDLMRKEIMVGALFSALHHLCDNWKTDSKGSQESIDLYERYYKAYKQSGRKVTSCHK